MKPTDDKKGTVIIRAVSKDEEGHKRVENVELNTHNTDSIKYVDKKLIDKGLQRVEKVELNTHKTDTIKYVEKKLIDKGLQRMERHPKDGLPLSRQPPKAGHGGKYTWEGPVSEAEAELDPAPVAVDERDPNYVDDEERAVRGEDEVVEVAEGREGGAKIEVDPLLEV